MKFKVGDRVRIYGVSLLGQDPLANKGEVIEVFEARIRVKPDQVSDFYSFHPKQCRKLKPKRKRIEGWVNIYPTFMAGLYDSKESADSRAAAGRQKCILVREVLEKK